MNLFIIKPRIAFHGAALDFDQREKASVIQDTLVISLRDGCRIICASNQCTYVE